MAPRVRLSNGYWLEPGFWFGSFYYYRPADHATMISWGTIERMPEPLRTEVRILAQKLCRDMLEQ